MGWKVAVSFRPSARHGTGIFATRSIKAGTRIWEYDRGMAVLDRSGLEALEGPKLSQALLAGYLHQPSQLFLWCSDGMQYMNHAPVGEANVGLGYWPRIEEDHIVAFRNIRAGEELLEDYSMCLSGGLAPGHWMQSLYLRFCPDHYAYLLTVAAGELTPELQPAVPHQEGTKRRTTAASAPNSTGLASTASKSEARQAA